MPPLKIIQNPNFGQADEIEQPDWNLLIPDPEDGDAGNSEPWRDIARREWARIVKAMKAAETLAPENRHQIQRLVLSYLRYDLAASKVFAQGAIVESPNTKVPMHNPWRDEMRGADADATTTEMELGLPPRRRGAATKVKSKPRQAGAADGYLGAVKKNQRVS